MAGDYQRGEMDIHEQSATFEAFGKMTKWGSLAIAVLLLTITLWFCTVGRLHRRRDPGNRAGDPWRRVPARKARLRPLTPVDIGIFLPLTRA
jgi:hypothetical protein